MLVLSRRQDDKVLFPNLGISVHILRVEGNKVRVGVDAPPEVKVLRHELQDIHDVRPSLADRGRRLPSARGGEDRDLRRRLAIASETLNKLYQLCDQDLQPEAEQLVFDIFRHLRSIDEGGIAADGSAIETSPPNPDKRPRRALLVEDNLNESRLLASYLRMQEFDVAVAGDGAAAIDFLDTHEAPDIVLLDMRMPGVDGPAAIRHLRRDKRHRLLKVYAVSGTAPADYGISIGPKGVDGWFPKPLDPEALVFRLAFGWNEDATSRPPRSYHRKDSMACS